MMTNINIRVEVHNHADALALGRLLLAAAKCGGYADATAVAKTEDVGDAYAGTPTTLVVQTVKPAEVEAGDDDHA